MVEGDHLPAGVRPRPEQHLLQPRPLGAIGGTGGVEADEQQVSRRRAHHRPGMPSRATSSSTRRAPDVVVAQDGEQLGAAAEHVAERADDGGAQPVGVARCAPRPGSPTSPATAMRTHGRAPVASGTSGDVAAGAPFRWASHERTWGA